MSGFAVRRSSSLPGAMVQAIDFLAICAGGVFAFMLRFGTDAQMSPVERMMVLAVACFAAFFFGQVYRMWPGGSLPAMVARVSLGWSFTWALLAVILVMTKSAEMFSRGWLVTWLLAGAVSLWAGRTLAFFIMARMRRFGYQHHSVILYGDSNMLQTVKKRLAVATWSGFDVIATAMPGDGANLEELDAKLHPEEIWISLNMADRVKLDQVMYCLRNSVANIRLLPDLMMYQVLNQGMSVAVGIPMVDLSISPMFGSRRVLKATLDFSFALVALIVLSPLLFTIAIAIKLTSHGPVLFQQKRHGWNNEEIWVYKFRSMAMHEEKSGVVLQASRGDSRVTSVGRFLRRTSLDELPQFMNVLQGRMSVVGPRPHALAHNDAYKHLIPKYALRHKVKPGITGWAQICGFRGETDTLDKMEGRIRHDIFYLENWSVWMDIKVIFLTPLAVLQNKNVY